ncbi:FG-GAP repeat protein [Saltatorellus ferox]|uniref:FG-GAP repeat protein n=1 Tax=Saltatorellus ferox TaxID=2528018 RepID=UPI003AF3F84C
MWLTTAAEAAIPQGAPPFNQPLPSPAATFRARFGTAVAASERTAIIGAPGDSASGVDAGAVHVFLREELTGAFTISQELRPTAVNSFDRFGEAIAIGGNLLVVGAKGDDQAAPNAGAAYVFRRFGFGSPFVLVDKLVAPNAGINDGFGCSVAVLADKIAVGAPRADETAFDAGTVYTYTFDLAANTVTLDGLIQDPTGRAGDGFGEALAVAPATLAVGAARLDAPSGPQNSGGVVIYEAQGATGMQNWVKVQTLFPSQPTAYAGFGSALAMEPPRQGATGTLVVGAPEAMNGSLIEKGTVSIYTSALPVSWGLVFTYGLNEPGGGNRLGASVAIQDDVVLAGAPGRTAAATAGGPLLTNRGSVDLLRRSPTTGWSKERTIQLPQSDEYWYVGASVAMRSGYPLIGAPGAEFTPGIDEQGTAWSVCYAWAPLGELLCAPAVPNSTGRAASLVARGSDVANDRNLTLEAAFLPRFSFAYALASLNSGFSAAPGGSQGNICLSGGVGRLVQDFTQAGTDGRIDIVINTASLPQPIGTASVSAGETWWFQVWYRDANPAVTSNFTDAVGIAFR